MGRKGKYQTHVEPRLSEIRELYGTMTEAQIADALGVSVAAFEIYKNQHPELRAALADGKKMLVRELRETMKKKAQGFYFKETKKTIRDINGARTQVIEEFERYSPPDVGALHLLLKNLDDSWRNDDAETMRIKREKLEIDKTKAEGENW